MAANENLSVMLDQPQESLNVEYKTWLNLNENDNKARIAKAIIALANHGGGFVCLGMSEEGETWLSVERPDDIPDVSQDQINGIVRRFADPEFHVRVEWVACSVTERIHPVIIVPSDIAVPVTAKRDCQGIIAQNACYIRKPGPRSEPPQTAIEWRALFNRCVREHRADMLEAIRAIVQGRVEQADATVSAQSALQAFSEAAVQRWHSLTSGIDPENAARFPHGFYDLSFSLNGVAPTPSLSILQERLEEARRIKLTGWSVFVSLGREGAAPYPYEGFVEAWPGNPADRHYRSEDPSLCDFWRASQNGELFLRRGYTEDGLDGRQPGQIIDVTLPIWRVSEAALFALRLSDAFGGADQILINGRFTGLAGRELAAIAPERYVSGGHVCRQGEVSLSSVVTPTQLRENSPEVLHELLTPLYEQFNFFRLPMELVEAELARLTQHRF